MKEQYDHYAHLVATDCTSDVPVFKRALQENKQLCDTQVLWINCKPDGWEQFFEAAQDTADVILVDNATRWLWERSYEVLAHTLRAYLVDSGPEVKQYRPKCNAPSLVTGFHDDMVPPRGECFRQWLADWVRHADSNQIHFADLTCWGNFESIRVDIPNILGEHKPGKKMEDWGESPHAQIWRWHEDLTWRWINEHNEVMYEHNFFLRNQTSTLCPWPMLHYRWVSEANRQAKKRSPCYSARLPMANDTHAKCMKYDPKFTIEQWAEVTQKVISGKKLEGVFLQELGTCT